jgi:septal ring factor EnvC (AmiA/AmiB activator)
MPGKLHLTESNAESLRQEVEELKADRARLLESSTDIIKKIRQEFQSQLKTEHTAREQVEAELAELKQNSTTANRNLPEAADLLNQLKAKRKKSTVSLADVETLLEIIEKSCDDTPKGLFPLSKGAFLRNHYTNL